MAFVGDGMQRGATAGRSVLLVALVTVGVMVAAAAAEARERHNPWHAGPPSAADAGEPGGFSRGEPRSAGSFPPPDYDPARRGREERSRVPAGEARPAPGMSPYGYGFSPYPYGGHRGPGASEPGMSGYGFPFFGGPGAWGPFSGP